MNIAESGCKVKRILYLVPAIILLIVSLQRTAAREGAGLRFKNNQPQAANKTTPTRVLLKIGRPDTPQGGREINQHKTAAAAQIPSSQKGDGTPHHPLFLKNYDWLDELLKNIWAVESGGQLAPPDGDAGQAIGPLQIHADVLDDVNRYYKTKFTCTDLRDIEKAKLVARVYITMWMEIHKEEIACRIFNGGPRGWQKAGTDEYWQKIKQIRR